MDQAQPGSASTKTEGFGDDAQRDNDDLLEEIAELKAELEERPTREEVDELEEKIQKHKHRKREWRENVNYLSTKLYEAESARDEEEGLKEELQWKIEELRKDLGKKILEKEEALAQLQSLRPDSFDTHEFLRGGLGEVPPKPNPVSMVHQERRRFVESTKQRWDKHIFPVDKAGAIKWADKGGRFVVCLPTVVYNGKTQLTEPFRGDLITSTLYEVIGADKDNVYYGTYRCIKKVTIDWVMLSSFGREFVASFLDRIVVQKEFAAPAIVSLVRHMYETGSLKVECLAFQYEGPTDVSVARLR